MLSAVFTFTFALKQYVSSKTAKDRYLLTLHHKCKVNSDQREMQVPHIP